MATAEQPGLVSKPSQPPPAPAAVPPHTEVSATTPAQPAPTPAQPAVVNPEFKMPELVPLTAGEEIAPGVVRLPRDSAPISFPEARSFETPVPKQNPAYTAIINNLNITGIRENSSGGFLMLGSAVYKQGDLIDSQNKLEFLSVENGVISFKDPAGAVYTRRF